MQLSTPTLNSSYVRTDTANAPNLEVMQGYMKESTNFCDSV